MLGPNGTSLGAGEGPRREQAATPPAPPTYTATLPTPPNGINMPLSFVGLLPSCSMTITRMSTRLKLRVCKTVNSAPSTSNEKKSILQANKGYHCGWASGAVSGAKVSLRLAQRTSQRQTPNGRHNDVMSVTPRRRIGTRAHKHSDGEAQTHRRAQEQVHPHMHMHPCI